MTISVKDDIGKSDKGKGSQLQKKTDGASRDRKRSRLPDPERQARITSAWSRGVALVW